MGENVLAQSWQNAKALALFGERGLLMRNCLYIRPNNFCRLQANQLDNRYDTSDKGKSDSQQQ